MVDFVQIRNFLTAEMGKASTKSWREQGTYCNTKSLAVYRVQQDVYIVYECMYTFIGVQMI